MCNTRMVTIIIIIIIIIIIDLTTEIQHMWNVKTKVIHNRGDWDYFKLIQKIREQHTRKT